MHISEFHIVNFKLFKDVRVTFDSQLCIFTGVNNSGKTTMLEALALWHECFSKLIRQAQGSTPNYQKGQFVLGNTQIKYFPFEQIKSVRCPNFEDIFYQKNRRNRIELAATFKKGKEESIEIRFTISESGMNYKIELAEFTKYDFNRFNDFFERLPSAIGFFYASPIAVIQQIESFSTPPQVSEAIINRSSASVLRNRLYSLYRSPDSDIFQRFLVDLSFILYNSTQKIEIFTLSDIQRDTRVIIDVKTNSRDTEKDIALLGSGTIQVLEILLNLYHSDGVSRDMNMVLLDEPDSHIHRDIQSRLMQVFLKFSKDNQIFITTHSEALIRSANISNLFHLESKSIGKYESLAKIHLQKIQPRFKGIYPTSLKPIISELGATNGLDFINAIEADVLIFVEGEDDARVYDALLRIQIRPKKYAYWILGGIDQAFKNLSHYKTVFTEIKNQKTLWEKSVLIIDRDYLTDAHAAALPAFLQSELDITTFMTDAYTLESTLLTNLYLLARLLSKWLDFNGVEISPEDLLSKLEKGYTEYSKNKSLDWNQDEFIENTAHAYKATREKLNELGKKKNSPGLIRENDIQIQTLVRNHIKKVQLEGTYYKLLRKDDVEAIIGMAIESTGVEFSIETNFIELIHLVDKSTWFDAWDYLLTI
ncbi:AAA family ATPase [Haliscomenobacter sp.]|uniref:ATP-dependent nuclease n=1 Tax=Haliscomenobacter sp. TaxID=2717303 RepID=UPI003364D95D